MDPISPLLDLWARRLMEQRMREADIMSPDYGALPDNLGATPMPRIPVPRQFDVQPDFRYPMEAVPDEDVEDPFKIFRRGNF